MGGKENGGTAAALLAVFLLLLAGANHASAAEFFTGTTINITGYSDCTSFQANATQLGYGASCTSMFSGPNCTSINATINITHAGNLTLENCEIRLNQTSSLQNIINSWGNFTVNRANITTNTSSFKTQVSIKWMSNFSMDSSFGHFIGYDVTSGQYGIELNATSTLSNITLRGGSGAGIYFDRWSNGSVVANLTSVSNGYGMFIGIGSGRINVSGASINGSSTYGIFVRGSVDNAIENVIIQNGSSHGITIASSSLPSAYITVTNTTIANSKGAAPLGMWISGVYNITVINASIRGFSEGVRIESGARNVTIRNTAIANNTQAGIRMTGTVRYITAQNLSIRNSTKGLLFDPSGGGPYQNEFRSIIIENSSAAGIQINQTQNTTFANMTIYSSAGPGVSIGLPSSYNISFSGLTVRLVSREGISAYYLNRSEFRNLVLQSTGTSGIALGSSALTVVSNASIWNCTPTAKGCVSLENSTNTTIDGTLINRSTNSTIYMANSDNTTFFNTVSLNPSYYDVFMMRAGAGITVQQAVFINASYANESVGNGQNISLLRQWYLDVHVNYTNASAALGANVSVWNSSGTLTGHNTANSTGWTSRLNMTQYVNDGSSLKYAGNYTVLANLSGFANASTSWAAGNGTGGSYMTSSGWSAGDWAQNNTRLALTLGPVVPWNVETITYDANGNRIGAGGLYFEYSPLSNQLSRVRLGNASGTIIEEYLYDHEGRRIYRRSIPENTTYYYPNRHFVRMVNSSGTFDTIYYYDSSDLIARRDVWDNNKTYYYHPDHLGSTTLITDQNGNTAEEITYEPYGLVFSGDPNASRFLYTGKELDQGSGLYYYGARYYDPELGQFVEPDPEIPDPYDPQMLNRFSYVRGNPYKYTDPSGNEPVQAQIGSYLTIANQLAVFEANKPSLSASQTLGNLVTFSGTFNSQPQAQPFLYASEARYGYTTQTGFIDNLHFFTAASQTRNDITGGLITGFLGYLTELFQIGRDPTSAFSYEDLRSNALGIEFATQLNDKDPLSVQYERFIQSKGGSTDPLRTFGKEHPDLVEKIPKEETGQIPIATCNAFCFGKAIPTTSGGGSGTPTCRFYGTCGSSTGVTVGNP